jgi:dTMP kinase
MNDLQVAAMNFANMTGSGFRDAAEQSLGVLCPPEVLAATPRRLRNLVDEVDFADPALTTPDGWSLAQTLYHFADSEAVFSVRLKSILLSVEPELAGYDHDLWLARIGKRPIRAQPTLERFELLRSENLEICANLGEQDLARIGRHVAHGQESIADLIAIRAGHDLLHLRPMEGLLGGRSRAASSLRGVPRGKDDPFNLPAKRGKLIVVCGIDGAGKTSQALEVVDWLRTLGLNAEYHKAVGIRSELDYLARRLGYNDHIALLGADVGRLIGATVRWKSMAAACAALRDESLWLVMDRYVYCEYAATRQQGAGNESLIREMYVGLPAPDIAFFLDISPEEAFKRVGERGLDLEALTFLNAFDVGYRSLPEMESFTVVDGARDFAQVRQEIRVILRERFAELADEHDG